MKPDTAVKPPRADTPEREYEKSGLYPSEGKPFRLVALLVCLTGVIIFLAASATILNFILI